MNKFLEELRRRNVVRVAVGYLALAWLAIQLVNELGPILGMPDWFPRLVVGLLAVGFVIAVVLSWIYELTDQGIRTTSEVDLDASLRSVGGRKLDFVIIGLLLLALGYFVWESRFAPVADAVDVRSIAVLPFQDLSPSGDQEHFADGMAEELLSVLSRLSGLRVAGRTSSFAFKGRDLPLEAIAGELGVTHILEGSIRTSGQRFRIAARLVSAADGFQVWSREFNGPMADVFSVQDQISAGVVEGLKVHFEDSGQEGLRPIPATANLEAYDEYLLGRYHLARRTAESLQHAQQHFRAAIALDPAYAPGWSALATTLAVSPYYLPVDSPADLAEQIRMTARRALELDADNSEAYAALGSVQMAFDRDWAAAADALAKAVSLSPSDAVSINLYGDYFYVIGDYASALTWESHAAELEPLSAVHQHELALVLGFLGRLDEAIERESRAVRLNPEFRNAWSALVRMLIESGQHEEARTVLTEQAAVLGTGSSLWLNALLELAVGNRESARAAADSLAAEAGLKQRSLTHAAYLFARLGDDHQAADLVRAAVAAGDPILVSPLYFFLPEDFPAMPQLRSALDQPELRALFNLRRINFEAGTGRAYATPD